MLGEIGTIFYEKVIDGLANTAARMKSVGGKFEINLAIDGLGTTCKFIVPLDKVENILTS